MAWNRPSEAPKVAPKKPNAMRGIVAGLVTVCALGGLCLWMFSNGEATSSSLQKKGRGRIKEVTPAVAPTNKVVEATAKPKKKEMPTHRDERGIPCQLRGVSCPCNGGNECLADVDGSADLLWREERGKCAALSFASGGYLVASSDDPLNGR